MTQKQCYKHKGEGSDEKHSITERKGVIMTQKQCCYHKEENSSDAKMAVLL